MKFDLLSSASSEENLRLSISKWFMNEPYEIIMNGKYKTIQKNGKTLDHYRIRLKGGRFRFEANFEPFIDNQKN